MGGSRAVAMGCHDTPQLMRRLKVAGEHWGLLVARGGDGWPARHREFGW
jgi:hypothetical protein